MNSVTSSSSVWSFWSIYIRYGLNGSLLNIVYLYPISVFFVIVEIILNSLNTYSTAVSVDNLSKIQSVSVHLSLHLFIVLFTSNISTYLRKAFRKTNDRYKYLILGRIWQGIDGHIQKADADTRSKISLDDRFDAYNKLVGTYNDITDIVLTMISQIVNSFVLCLFTIYKQPLMFIIISCVSFVMIYINRFNTNKQKPDSDKFWSDAYYEIVTQEGNVTNPCFEKYNYTSPDVPEKYLNLTKHYLEKFIKWNDTTNFVNCTKNAMIFIVLLTLIHFKLYDCAMIVLINRQSLFGAFTTYDNFIQCEKRAHTSLEKVVKLLTLVSDQSKNKEDDCIVTSFDNKQLSRIYIEKLKININSQTNRSDEFSGMRQNILLKLDSALLKIENNKCLLIEGKTGCGKSVTLNVLAGLYCGKVCENMTVSFKDGTISNCEFNKLVNSRYYINQLISDDYKYNRSIQMPMSRLFPNANGDFLKDFLTTVFKLDNIPELNECPKGKLSGGEIQRYVIASQIWKAIQSKPDIVILDEIDKALDKDTAVHIMSWIIRNLKCYFVIVTHLTEVKQMLKEKYINQIWTYESDGKEIRIKTEIF